MDFKLLAYREHQNETFPNDSSLLVEQRYETLFNKIRNSQDVSLPCYIIKRTETNYKIETSYFIGVDWIVPERAAICISPKLNKQNSEVDFIKMLFSCLRHSDLATEINELFEVKWNEPPIEIEQKRDLLTPFLVVEFLSLIKTIVRKGLKKSYYRVEQNLNSRVKGKISVGKTIKQNLLQNKNLYTVCTFEEYGLNNLENRLLKKALTFVKRYLPNYTQLASHRELTDTFNFINPAFHTVSDEIELSEIKSTKVNAFYKEYKPAMDLAKLILKRFGYNISNTKKQIIKTPPFWIDMSKLFELYALGLLKDRFQKQVQFQFKGSGSELDFLLNHPEFKMVIDTKYKLKYLNGVNHEDIRQVSGYARLEKVYETLGIEKGKTIDCLIIYPDQENGFDNLEEINLRDTVIPKYYDIFKLGLKLPTIN
ncbi:MAG: hypothetical protein COW03_02140 [Cytophagales bacterium CG12_big_fil_rev_8_21_14_0_65_40_12]|nr:MAG: hypothetical protein COW03_02140 [Cytophagales bacterium CG12_big_fil_rev_8_21_14_0_65_40_12]PIW04175.1 MAG: hypothetical protein COW40_10595 [Cytophagales bacterium CG17_big_fil_post_rev_8_21_14_2_50_40_13]